MNRSEMKSMNQNERWVDVKGYGENYEVSNTGLIRHKATQKIKKKQTNQDGYHRLNLWNKKEKRSISCLVHRLVYESFLEDAKGFEINHIDGDKTNNHISNLEKVTRSSNMKHAKLKGLLKPRVGSDNGRSKLNLETAKKIRKEYQETNCQKQFLAKKYKVSNSTIGRVINGENWRDEL
ncbi:NUMOD4 motif-containing HNH endonuclease [Bacillus cereus]|uniref:NUMOD4 motif-containing HNH endonuclease n=1 Tax=Bacillus cereus TaxID=1396 RepID=UPI0015CF1BE7|nr:NUMOD4 motif-containing HNH endonuclease [Bacillus cereus]